MTKTFITVASWEERFVHSLEGALSSHPISEIICLASQRYLDRTATNREIIAKLASSRGVAIHHIQSDFLNTIDCFDAVQRTKDRISEQSFGSAIFDISTAPRQVIWLLLNELGNSFESIDLRYVRASKYGQWQTDKDLDPRLTVNCSGVMYPDRQTCLVMLCGPEISRAEKMIFRFEPKQALILRDVNAQDYGTLKQAKGLGSYDINEQFFDHKDLTENNIIRAVDIMRPLASEFNVICSSFGPKLGAVLLFLIQQRIPSIGLSYVPAGIHNLEISTGSGLPEQFSVPVGVKFLQ